MSQKYQIGEYIRYGSNGVCLIDDIRLMGVAKENDLYYILRPIADRNSTFFIPVESDTAQEKMRTLLTREEIDALIDSVHVDLSVWIDDRKQRMDHYRVLLRECDPRELLKLAALLYYRKDALSAEGKKLSPSDLNVLKQIIELTDNEFSFVLNIDPKEVGPYIRNRTQMNP